MNQINNTEKNRYPVISIVGHVDHGKSSFLDYIRKTELIKREAGGITQHASSYEFKFKNKDNQEKSLTFIDTPGHEIFFNIKEKSSKICDIAILIISLDDGVKPQTKIAIKILKETKTPYIVALNKVDKSKINLEKVKKSLNEHGVFIEGEGGDIPCFAISAKTGEGINDVLESLVLLGDIIGLKGSTQKLASGFVLESFIDKNRGITANLIVKDGSIKIGDYLVIEDGSNCKVKVIEDFKKKSLKNATFSSPIYIYYLSKLSATGSTFKTFSDKKDADKYLEELKSFEEDLKEEEQVFNYGFFSQEEDLTSTILVILKADVFNSLEALIQQVKIIKKDNIKIKILTQEVGNINQNDIRKLQDFNEVFILGFNVNIEKSADNLSKNFTHVKIKTSKIIYELLDYLNEQLELKISCKKVNLITGKSKVLKIFDVQKNKILFGGEVIDGSIFDNNQLKIERRGVEIGSGIIINLQKVKEKVKQVNKGEQFGMLIESKIEIIKNDILIFNQKSNDSR